MFTQQNTQPSRKVPENPDKIDVAMIAAVPLVLAAIHVAVPESVKAVLAFNHGQFNIWGLYTSALVQNSYEQLLGNCVAYLIAAVGVYWLCIRIRYLTWFRRNFLLILAVLPPVTVLTSYVLGGIVIPVPVPSERGFSGVASGFAGLLWMTVIVYLGEKFDYELGLNFGISLLILLILEAGFAYAGFSDPYIYIVGGFGIVLIAGTLAWQRRPHLEQITDVSSETVFLVGYALIALVILVYGMFPGYIVDDGNFVNVFSHFAGFVFAVPIASVTWYLSR
jgi:hypothetical protein